MKKISLSRSNKAYLCMISLFVYQIISILSGLIIPRSMIKAYGSAYNGLISSITNYLEYFSIIQAGIAGASRVALYNTLAKGDKEGTKSIMASNSKFYHKISNYLVAYIFLLSVLFTLYFKSRFNGMDVFSLVLIIGIGNFFQYFFGEAYITLLEADGSSYISNFIRSFSLLLNIIITVVLINQGASLRLAKFCCIVTSALSMLVIYIIVVKKFQLNNKVKQNNISIKNRNDALGNAIANAVHLNVDIFFITLICVPEEVSVFSIYYLINNGMIRMIQIFTNSLEAPFGDMYAKKEFENLKENFHNYEFILFYVTSILSSCLFVLLTPFIKVYTLNINDVVYVRPTLALLITLSFITYSIRSPYVTLVQAAGKYKETKVGSYFEAGLNILLTMILVKLTGINGAVIGTIVANLFRSLQYGNYVYRNIIYENAKKVFSKILWLCISLFLNIIVVRLFTINLTVNNWIGWIMLSLITFLICIFVSTIFAFLFYKKEIKKLIKRLKIVKN